MKDRIFAALIIIVSLAVIYAFFMPWASIEVSGAQVSEKLSKAASEGPLKDTPRAAKFISKLQSVTKAIEKFGDVEVKSVISGNDIPTLVSRKESKTGLYLMQFFFKDASRIESGSKLVYLLPLLAIACIALAVIAAKHRIAAVIIAAIGGVISVAGLYKLSTLGMADLPVTLKIENGLWLTMYAYLAVCVVSAAWYRSLKKQ